MRPNSLIIIAIVILMLLGGSFLVWWFFISSPPPVPEQTNRPVSSYGQTSVTLPIPGQQGESIVNLDAEYDDLFQKLTVRKIAFTFINSSLDAEGLYELYAQDIAETKKSFPAASDFVIGVALLDLNDDGSSEALVFESLPGICGTAGCPLDVYKKENDKWKNLFSVPTGAGENIGISNMRTNGYAELYLGQENSIVRFTWDGSAYQEGEVVAVWNGTTFVLPRVQN